MNRYNRICLVLLLAIGMIKGVPGTVCAAEQTDGSVAVDAVNFPDASFREYLRKNYDKNENMILEKEERDIVYEMSVGENPREQGEGIWQSAESFSLQGIEYFANIKELTIYEVSKLAGTLPDLPSLERITLVAVENQTADLDAWHQKLPLTKITWLSLWDYRTGDLDLKSMAQLEHFSMDIESDRVKDSFPRLDSEYYVGAIRFSENKKLEGLNLSAVKVKELDFSGNKQLHSLLIFDSIIKSKRLNISNLNRLEGVTIGAIKELKTLSIKKNKNLKDIRMTEMRLLKKLECSGNSSLKSLWFEKVKGMKALKFAGCEKLEDISILYLNDLQQIDVTKNKNLKALSISGMGPKTLDLTKNRKLRELEIFNQNIRFTLPKKNRLQSLTVKAYSATLDLTSCVALRSIRTYSYGRGAKVKMKRTVFKRLWNSQKLKIYDNYRNRYTVKNKKVRIPNKGKYVVFRI